MALLGRFYGSQEYFQIIVFYDLLLTQTVSIPFRISSLATNQPMFISLDTGPADTEHFLLQPPDRRAQPSDSLRPSPLRSPSAPRAAGRVHCPATDRRLFLFACLRVCAVVCGGGGACLTSPRPPLQG